MSRRLILWTMAVSAVVGGGGWAAWKWAGSRKGPDTGPKIAKVKRGNITQSIKTDGRVEARLIVEVKSKASGIVERVPVGESEPVEGPELIEVPLLSALPLPLWRLEPGRPLAELNPVDEQRNVDRAASEMAAAEAQLRRARAERDRVAESVELDVRSAEADRRAAEAELAQATAQAAATEAQCRSMGRTATEAESKAVRQKALAAQKLTSAEELESALTAAEKLKHDLEESRANCQAAAARRDLAGVRVAQAALKVGQAVANRRNVDNQKAEVDLAEARLGVARAGLQEAVRRLEETRIAAPITGVVVSRTIEPGMAVASATASFGGGTTLFKIADVGRMFVTASVPEADIAGVRDPVEEPDPADPAGRRRVWRRQPCTVTADAYPGRKFAGEVVYRVPQAVTENKVTSVKVRIEVTDPDRRLLLTGMSAGVDILVRKAENALVIPAAAVERDDDAKTYVYLPPAKDADGQPLKDDKGKPLRPKKVPVKIGILTATQAEVLDGLTEGQEVIASSAAVEPEKDEKDEKP
jgi:HlyD family secretion protein